MPSQKARLQLLNGMSNHGVTKELSVKSSHFVTVKQGSHRKTVAEPEPRSPGSICLLSPFFAAASRPGFTGDFVIKCELYL